MANYQKRMIYGQLETMGYYLPDKQHPSINMQTLTFIKNNPRSCLQKVQKIEYDLPVFLPSRSIATEIKRILALKRIKPWFVFSLLPPKKYLITYLYSIDKHSYFFSAGYKEKTLQKKNRTFNKSRKISDWMKKKIDYHEKLEEPLDMDEIVIANDDEINYKDLISEIFSTGTYKIFLTHEASEEIYDEYFGDYNERFKVIRKVSKIVRLIDAFRAFKKKKPT
ncbi:MAG: hypothetical protein ACRYGG_22755 [Janthinobacterium lividum]